MGSGRRGKVAHYMGTMKNAQFHDVLKLRKPGWRGISREIAGTWRHKMGKKTAQCMKWRGECPLIQGRREAPAILVKKVGQNADGGKAPQTAAANSGEKNEKEPG